MLKGKYGMKICWDRALCVCTSLKWNCTRRAETLSIKGPMKNMLIKCSHIATSRNDQAQREPEPTQHGANQHAKCLCNRDLLPSNDEKEFQCTIGSLLYHGRIIDYTMLTVINDLSIMQKNPLKHPEITRSSSYATYTPMQMLKACIENHMWK